VLKDVNFTVGEGEYVIVLGPSGCGKTTLLKTIAGIYQPDSGSVLIDGVDVTNLPPEERGIGFFFQHYALFPHMTVSENVGYSLQIRGMNRQDIHRVVSEKLAMVGLSAWADNYPLQLSGGMQQRVALARALATGSKLLLLDEPLNALDAKIASILRTELREMARKLKLTILQVTPNQEEAIELAHRIILMKDGVIVQVESDVDSYLKPKTPYSAYFIGESNFLRAKRVDAHLATCGGVPFSVKHRLPETEVVLAVRPEKIRFEQHEHNTFKGAIENINFLGKTLRYEVGYKSRHVYVETSKHPDLKVGDSVYVHFPPEDIMVFGVSEHFDDEIPVI